jgi:hypothetical protein
VLDAVTAKQLAQAAVLGVVEPSGPQRADGAYLAVDDTNGCIRQHSGPSPPRYASQSERPAIFRESVSNVARRRFVVDVLGILEHAHSTLDFVRARRIPVRRRIFNAIPHGRKRTAEI